MQTRNVGFMSSWKMLTRDKGWVKPLLILGLVGWIPILGQIAVMGFGYEWARLTAWGADAAPKQRGVDVGKVIATGCRTFFLVLIMTVCLNVVLGVLLPGDVHLPGSPSGVGVSFTPLGILDGETQGLGALVSAALGLLAGTLFAGCALRATLYDGFGAGWRLDRVFQMVSRDVASFMRTYLVGILCSLVIIAAEALLAVLLGTLVIGGFMGVAFSQAASASLGYGIAHEGVAWLIGSLLSLNPAWLLLLVVAAILGVFACSVVAVTMELVYINAVGLWFRPFEVSRWGVSSDPLPEGVPAGSGSSSHGGAPAAPADWSEQKAEAAGAAQAATPADVAFVPSDGADGDAGADGPDAAEGGTAGTAGTDGREDGGSVA